MPESRPDRLTELRRELEDVEATVATAEEHEDESGERVDPALYAELRRARGRLHRAEAEEARRAGQ